MKNRYHKHFKVKKIFSALLLSYGALLMVPIIMVLVLVLFWTRSTESYYKGIVTNELTQCRMEFEKKLDVFHAGASSLLYNNDLAMVCHLDGLQEKDPNISILMRCIDNMNEKFTDSEKYYNYCVVLKNGLSFRKSGMSNGRQFFYDNYRKYEEMTYEEWKNKSFYADSWKLFTLQKIDTDSEEEALTYSYPVRFYYNQKEANAVVQFLLPRQELENMFDSLQKMNGKVLIFAEDGTRLAALGTDATELTLEELPALDTCEIIKMNGEEQMVACQRSEDGNLIFATVLPAENSLLYFKQTKRIAWIVLLVSLLFEVGMGCQFSLRYSDPLRNIIDNMQRMFTLEEKEEAKKKRLSDYEFLEKGVHTLMDRNKTMKSMLNEKKEKEKKNFLALLLNGELQSEEVIRQEAEYVGIDLCADSYCVAAITIRGEKKRIEEKLDACTASYIRAYYWNEETILILIIACSRQENETLEDIRKKVYEICLSKKEESVYIGYGKVYENIEDIPFSFQQAQYCMKKAARENNCKEYVEYNKTLVELNMLWCPAQLEEKLMNATQRGKTTEIRKIFTELRKQNVENTHLSTTMSRLLISNITVILLQLYNNIAESEKAIEKIERIEKEEELEEALRLLEEQFLLLGQKIEQERNKKSEQYYYQVKEYIDNNYMDDQFCVAAAAENFGLSESYFSIFFKNIMGKTFSNYLEEIRLQKAKELIQEKKDDLEQIAKMVGYSSSATFRRAFKRVYGISPSEWKS